MFNQSELLFDKTTARNARSFISLGAHKILFFTWFFSKFLFQSQYFYQKNRLITLTFLFNVFVLNRVCKFSFFCYGCFLIISAVMRKSPRDKRKLKYNFVWNNTLKRKFKVIKFHKFLMEIFSLENGKKFARQTKIKI